MGTVLINSRRINWRK